MYGRAYYLVRKKWPEMYSHYPLRVTSLATFSKLITSWTIIPFMDAITKAKKLDTKQNGFEILIISMINISNRIGISFEWWFDKND